MNSDGLTHNRKGSSEVSASNITGVGGDENTDTKHPDISVQLTGRDGNAMSIMAAVTKALRRNGHADEVDDFMAEAMSGDYDNVIATAMRWVDVS